MINLLMINNILPCIVLSLSSVSCVTVGETFEVTPPMTILVKTTAYTHSEKDHIKYGKKTASGTTLQVGVCACDWSVFPLGTILKVNGLEYKVEDYGSALVNKKVPVVDIYKPTRSAMNKWGASHIEIEVVKWGCFEESRDILESRLKHHHCKVMYDNITSIIDA